MARFKNNLNDPLPPFLSLALDGNIRRHFCQALITDKVDASITGCRVTRMRFRRGQRCIIQYELVLRLADRSEQTHYLVGYLNATGDLLQKRYSMEDFEALLARSRRVLTNVAPTYGSRLGRLAQRIARQMNHGIYSPAHLDLKPEHIFFNAGRITLIDIGSAVDADPMIDTAILYANLRHAQILYDLPDMASQLFAVQLMRDYHKLAPSAWWGNFSVCYAWALLTLAVDLFVRRRPDWLHWVHCFVNEAKMAINLEQGRLPLLSEGSHRVKTAFQNESIRPILASEGVLA